MQMMSKLASSGDVKICQLVTVGTPAPEHVSSVFEVVVHMQVGAADQAPVAKVMVHRRDDGLVTDATAFPL